ncbi:hypothetical protein [Mycolicibacterium peregrinum]|uniref:PE-PGRS family protein n=1 Tax=Mycolicibacterium peregrinum TaxID=43304 RepID=A0A1A0WHV4_MYCPR|nr:hypothetical protein [Mycolicibacterium peregrinum]OBB98574.1 hypothetical protein A5779_00955 [Mycolicibacterium peregrinum]
MPSSEPKETELNLALRPYATAGIALVGASVIAATPLTPPPEVHLPALSSQASVELSSFTNPLGTWAELLTKATTNAEALGQIAVDNPFPILRQIIANQTANASKPIGSFDPDWQQVGAVVQQIVANRIANATQVGTILQSLAAAAQGLLDPNNPYSSVTRLQLAFNDLLAGEVGDAITYAWMGLVTAPATQLGFNALTLWDPLVASPARDFGQLATVLQLGDAVSSTATNFGKFVGALPGLVVIPGQSFLNGMMSAVTTAVSDSAQGFVDAVKAGDAETAASIAINFPAVMAGAVLNGYSSWSDSGLLGKYGPLNSFLKATEAVARAIGKPKPKPPLALTPAEASTVPDTSVETTVTLPAFQSPTAAKTAAVQPDSVAASPTDSASAAPGTAAADSPAPPAPELAKRTAAPLVRGSVISVPGKTGTLGATSKRADKVASDVRDGISSTVNKIGEGVKKAFAKPEKKSTSKSTDKGPSASSEASK